MTKKNETINAGNKKEDEMDDTSKKTIASFWTYSFKKKKKQKQKLRDFEMETHQRENFHSFPSLFLSIPSLKRLELLHSRPSIAKHVRWFSSLRSESSAATLTWPFPFLSSFFVYDDIISAERSVYVGRALCLQGQSRRCLWIPSVYSLSICLRFDGFHFSLFFSLKSSWLYNLLK